MPDSLGKLLGKVCRLFRGRMYALWDDMGLYRGQPFLLGILWEREGVTHSELASQMHVSPATVTNTLKRMEKAGFVERRPDLEDQRVSRVYLTDAGRAIRTQVDAHWQEIESQVFGALSEQDRENLTDLLERVREELVRLRDERTLGGRP
jgi:DNA-binding MarR family transcriptional regulator